MDNNTIKEICDVVTDEVIKQVQQKLSEMKPDLIKTITEASVANAVEIIRKNIDVQNDTTIYQIQQKNAELEKRIVQLETQIKKSSAPQTSTAKPTKIASTLSNPVITAFSHLRQVNTTEKTSTTKPTRIAPTAIDNINTLSAKQIDDILSFPDLHIIGNGWIYYYKIIATDYDEWGEIYKVQPDGTENQKIFNGKASGYENDIGEYFNLKGNKLFFEDNEGNRRVIEV